MTLKEFHTILDNKYTKYHICEYYKLYDKRNS